MGNSLCFELACEILENETHFNGLEARGTLRLALKAGGLDARTVTPHQMGVIVGHVLPNELRTRGVDEADAVCRALEAGVAQLETALDLAESPEAVFARLGGG